MRNNCSLALCAFLHCLLLGERYGSTSFRKKLKLARISYETAGTYRIVARGKYCQFERKVEVRVISKYYLNMKKIMSLDHTIKSVVYQGSMGKDPVEVGEIICRGIASSTP